MPYIILAALGLTGFNLVQANKTIESTGEAAKKAAPALGYVAIIAAVGGSVYLVSKVAK
ncbi:hypothetical protein [Photobacterium damselae]|uniref:hypothetical protein n=1 Tax=Photobacterium damselae TaxID=38293 RepID=UPI00159F04B5|nr:hypothetical protein [Photobacterium damselae]